MSDATLLVPTDEYLKSGIHIGTKFKTKYMEDFIYKIREDGLSVLNLKKIDKMLALGAKFLARYNPEDIIVVSRRENGWKPIKMFGEATGARAIPGRYPPGMLTNPSLDIFTEAKVLVVVDAWPDRNAVNDALNVGIPIVALCDTNNTANNVDLVIPCNNKGKKALGLIFWLLAREYLKNRGVIKQDSEFKYKVEDFTAV
ncbi:30S ribosomal protein S2 [Candidatus Woesearchaeota archaeon]|nr:30S ribosomal protein S2 [Candidatus Woesearchaeota archaeon]